MNPISAVILKMSESPAWERRISSWPATRRVVRRFMPGEHLDDAVAAAVEINRRGMSASLNPVGEHVHSEAEATAATDAYVEILARIQRDRLDSNLSVKLSLLGLDVGTTVAAENLTRILEAAAGTFVRIDMEGSAYVERTLQLYRRLRSDHANLGVVIQSYLRRSAADVEELVREGAAVRLVKGAYREPPEIAYARKAEVDRNFEALAARMLGDDARANGVRLAIATHDGALVERAQALARARGVDSMLEFQMLYGIARDLQSDVARAGFPVRIYISYGQAWYPWFMRRLAERPANLGFFLRHLFR